MFRAQQNAFDEAIAKATDEQLTSENWELILDVCDRVTAEDTGAKDAVASMIRRLAHRNANVQLYTLELANSLSQNCGVKMHRELASRSFTDAVLRLANDRNTHQQVKAKIVELLGEWTEMFAKDPDLVVMEQAFLKLRSQNPTLLQPSKPTKQQITDTDRQKEEEELQLVLELSIKEKAAAAQAEAQAQAQVQAQAQAQAQSTNKKAGQAVTTAEVASTQQPLSSKNIPSGATAASVSRVRALHDFQPTEAGELQFQKGEIIAVLESVFKDWWRGSLRGQTGIFPLNYVEKILDPTREELQREAQAEAEVFGEIKNVEKLLTLLSTSSPESTLEDNEEVTALYQSMLAVRPKLVELIKKYTQRKDDFSHLNEKFIKASRDYELLLDASTSQLYGRQPQQYGFGPGSYPGQGPSGQQLYPTQSTAAQQPSGRTYPSDPRAQVHNPLQNGPQPLFGAGQAAKPSSQGPLHFLPTDPRSRTPSGSSKHQAQPSDPYHPRPESTYANPQELGPSATPTTEARPQTYPSPKPAHTHPPPSVDDDLYSADDVPMIHHPPQQQQQQQQQAQLPYPSTPYIQIPPSGQQKPGSPNPGYQPGTYQAYHAPGAQQQHPLQGPKPSYTPGGGGNPNDFYG